jgi:cysteine desulfurase
MNIYLDYAATSPVSTDALEAAWPWLSGDFGNPSSQNELGFRAHGALEKSRQTVSAFLGCRANEITFTSGGTEADNLGIIGLALANKRGKHIISAKSEHEAVLASIDYLVRHHDFEVTWLSLDSTGMIDLSELAAALRDDTTLVSLMLANNEIGTIHPIFEVSKLAHERGALVHCDAVQAVGWLDISIPALGVDALALSGHKFGAPKGVGALYVRGRFAIEPLIHGGGQEFGRRSGTENVAFAVALATALEALYQPGSLNQRQHQRDVSSMRDGFVFAVLDTVPSSTFTGHRAQRLPNIASFTFANFSGEAMLLELEKQGVICSSGSACAAGNDAPSHVLMAIGVKAEVAQTAVRFSFGHQTNAEELNLVIRALGTAVRALSK